MYIEKINGPEDVKKLTVDEMTVMAGEMREALLKRASITPDLSAQDADRKKGCISL